jgi:hypothetical protein
VSETRIGIIKPWQCPKNIKPRHKKKVTKKNTYWLLEKNVDSNAI